MYIDAITLTTLVLDDNPLALRDQSVSIDAMLDLTQTLQVLSCRRCGLQVDVETFIPPAGSFSAEPKHLQELHLAQVRPNTRRGQVAGGEILLCIQTVALTSMLSFAILPEFCRIR